MKPKARELGAAKVVKTDERKEPYWENLLAECLGKMRAVRLGLHLAVKWAECLVEMWAVRLGSHLAEKWAGHSEWTKAARSGLH